MGVGGGRRPFSCPGGPGTAHNGGSAAGATHTRRMQKPPENRVKTAIPGVICKEGAARRRPGSHSSRPKRTSFAALEDSIADGAANGKGVKRANEALERANLLEKPRLRRRSARTGACVARARRARHLLATEQNLGHTKGQIPQNNGTASLCPFFQGFRAFEPQTRAQ